MSAHDAQPAHRIPAEVRLADGEPVSLSPATDDGPRRFEGVVHTGKPVNLGWGLRGVWNLAGIQGEQRMPALLNHGAIAGFTTEVSLGQAKPIRCAGVLSRKTAAAQEVVDLADEGFPWQMSAYLDASEFPDDVRELRKGESAEVNGVTVEGPDVIVYGRSRLREVTICPLGRDGDTHVAVLSAGAHFDRATLRRPAPTTDHREEKRTNPMSDPATLADLKAAFPDDPAFVLARLEAQSTLDDAKALHAQLAAVKADAEKRAAAEKARADDLAAKLAAAEERAAALAQRPEGVAPLRTPAEGTALSEPGGYEGVGSCGPRWDAWCRKVHELQLAEGIKRFSEATKLAARRYPDLHRAALEEINGSELKLVKHRGANGPFTRLQRA